MAKIKYFILTGDPGVGKTTIIKKLNSNLTTNSIKTYGFYTEEVRHNKVREGFDVVTLHCQRGRLARDTSLLNGPIQFKVGKYGVLIQEFENVALPTLKEPEGRGPHFFIIDEIGKMELFSNSFKSRVREIFSPSSNCIVLATIPLRKSDMLIENIRTNTNAKVWMITKENRNSIHEDISNVITMSLNSNI